MEVAVTYYETMADGLQLLYNIIHKLGNIYDCVYFLVQHHKEAPFDDKPIDGETIEVILDDSGDGEDGTVSEVDAFEFYEDEKEDWWFKLGIYYGTLINLFFYTPEDYVPYNPHEDIM